MIKVVLFDLDGTLINTYEHIFQAFKYSLKKNRNIDFTRKDFDKIAGPPLEECYINITNSENIKDLCDDHRAFQEQYINLSTPYPNVKRTLVLLKRKGIKIGLVTARTNKSVIKHLKLFKFDEYIDVIIGADNVTKHKPHPQPLLKALQILNEKPQNAIMVGDLEGDILAGKNAGIKTVGVTYGFIGKKIAKLNPDYVIDNAYELFSLPFLR